MLIKTFLFGLMCFLGSANLLADEGTDLFENLVPVEDAAVAMAYIDPDADFSVFQRVMILDPYVAFRANWQRDQRRSSRRINVSAADMERIKSDVAELFRDVFTERLAEDDGFEVVDAGGEDVLLLRPAIIDLDITAPDTRSPGRSRTFASSTGSATVYIELYDSLSGAILGRAADRKSVRNAGGTISWSNGVTNRADARRMMLGWADTLRAFLDSHYAGKTPE